MSPALPRTRALARTLAVILTTLALLGSGTVAAHAVDGGEGTTTASISGVVTDTASGEGLVGARVVILDAEGAHAGSANTVSSGAYTVSDLAAGDYRIRIEADGYEAHFWPASRGLGGAEAVPLATGQSLSGIDLALTGVSGEGEQDSREKGATPRDATGRFIIGDSEPVAFSSGSTISGRVTDLETGEGIPFAQVSISDQTAGGGQGITAEADGTYTYGLPEVGHEYDVQLGAPGYITEYFDGVHAWWEAEVFVADGTAYTNVDAALRRAAEVSGVVTDAGGLPIEGATVYFQHLDEWTFSPWPAWTQSDGSYEHDYLLGGSYELVVNAPGYLEVVSELTVADGEVKTGIDFVLTAESSISGSVPTTAPLGYGWAVEVYSETGGWFGWEGTEPDGTFSIGGLAAGEYRLQVWEWGGRDSYAPTWYGDVTDRALALVITLDEGEARTGVVVNPVLGSSISGTITLPSGTDEAYVWAERLDGQDSVNTVIGLDGSFVLSGLGPGEYRVGAEAFVSSEPERSYFLGYFAGAAIHFDATPVTVAGADVGNVDFGLYQTGTITGSIGGLELADPGDPIHYVAAYAWNGTSWELYGYDNSAIYLDGMPYRIRNLPSGTYKVGFIDHNPYPAGPFAWQPGDPVSSFCSEFWNVKATAEEADAVVVAGGAVTTGIDVALRLKSEGCEIVEPPLEVVAGTPTIMGTARFGSTLTMNAGSWGPEPVELSYRWLADGVEIPDATGTSLALGLEHIGARIRVEVTGEKAGYQSATRLSAQTAAVAPATLTAPVPKITGKAQAGLPLTAVPGSWTAGAAVSYQWYAAGKKVTGATSSTFTPGTSQVGKAITVKVTGQLAGYATVTKTSKATAKVAKLSTLKAPTPKITGTARPGATVKVSSGTWTSGTAKTYQWYVAGKKVTGATGTSFEVLTAHLGKKITVKVTGVKAGHKTVTKTSKAVTAKLSTLKAPTPKITGTAKAGLTLKVSSGTWTSGAVKTYQWYANGKKITGATGTSFTLSTEHVGKKITVKVTGKLFGYKTVTKTSKATGNVAKLSTLKTATPNVTSQTVDDVITLTVVRGSWTSGTSFAYQWFADGVPIDGATALTHELAAEHHGVPVTVRVTGSKAGYKTASKTSKPASYTLPDEEP